MISVTKYVIGGRKSKSHYLILTAIELTTGLSFWPLVSTYQIYYPSYVYLTKEIQSPLFSCFCGTEGEMK